MSGDRRWKEFSCEAVRKQLELQQIHSNMILHDVGQQLARGCLEPLYKIKALFVHVRSSQRNCDGSANDGGPHFPTHEFNEELRPPDWQIPRTILKGGEMWHHIANPCLCEQSSDYCCSTLFIIFL